MCSLADGQTIIEVAQTFRVRVNSLEVYALILSVCCRRPMERKTWGSENMSGCVCVGSGGLLGDVSVPRSLSLR